MWMTDREIYMSYKNAGETSTQVQILSELNACRYKEIIDAITRYSEIEEERKKNYEALVSKEHEESLNNQPAKVYSNTNNSDWIKIESKPKASVKYQHDVCKTYNVGQSKTIGESHTIYSEPKVEVKKDISMNKQNETRRSVMSEDKALTRNPEPTSGIASRNNVDTTKSVESTCSTHSSDLSSMLIDGLKNFLSDKGIEISIKIQTINQDKQSTVIQKIEESDNTDNQPIEEDNLSDEKLRWRKRTIIQNDSDIDWNNYIDSMRDHLSQAKECEKQLKRLERQHGSHRRKVKTKEE